MRSGKRFSRRVCVCAVWALAALSCFLPDALAEDHAPLSIEVLTPDLGDPRRPRNLKLAVRIPEALRASLPKLDNPVWRIDVYPEGEASPAVGNDRFRATGLLRWTHGGAEFIDVRRPPLQEKPCTCVVRVRLLTGEEVLAEGVGEARVTYTPGDADAVLVIDTSQSMIRSDPYKKRVDAAKAFVELARRNGGIGKVGIVAFANRAEILAPLTPLSEPDALVEALDRIGADGMTDMDDALSAAQRVFADSTAARQAIVFLTDGRNEPHRYKETHTQFAESSTPIFAIGLSKRADHELLQRMAEDTGGQAFNATEDRELMAIYQRLATEIGRQVLVLTETVRQPGMEFRIPVDDSIRRISFLADTDAEDGGLEIANPEGKSLADAVNARTEVNQGYRVNDVIAPVPGGWVLTVRGGTKDDPCTVTVTAETDLYLDLFPPQVSGRSVLLGATLAAGGDPLTGDLVRVHSADGSVLATLHDDGKHDDGAEGDGVYAGRFDLPPDAEGRFGLSLRAAGSTSTEQPYVREVSARLENVKPAPPVVAPTMTERILASKVNFGVMLSSDMKTVNVPITFISDRARSVRLITDKFHAGGAQAVPGSALITGLREGDILSPGKTDLAFTLRVPAGCKPGDYQGTVTLIAGRANAVLPVHFQIARVQLALERERVDLGVLHPGTSTTAKVRMGLDSPRPLPLDWQVQDEDDENVELIGKGRDPLQVGPENAKTIRVRVPLDAKPGPTEKTLVLRCGLDERKLVIRYTVPQPPKEEIPDPQYEIPLPERAESQDVERVPPPEVPEVAVDDSEPEDEDPSSPASAIDDDEAVNRAWDDVRPYLFWAIVLLILLLVLVTFLVRALVRDRMARFAAMSVLIHAIVVLIIANALVATDSVTQVVEQPRMVAKLVTIKRDMGLTLSEAEEELLRRVERMKEDEKRFTAMKEESTQREAEKKIAEIEHAKPESMAWMERRETPKQKVSPLERTPESVQRPLETPELAEIKAKDSEQARQETVSEPIRRLDEEATERAPVPPEPKRRDVAERNPSRATVTPSNQMPRAEAATPRLEVLRKTDQPVEKREQAQPNALPTLAKTEVHKVSSPRPESVPQPEPATLAVESAPAARQGVTRQATVIARSMPARPVSATPLSLRADVVARPTASLRRSQVSRSGTDDQPAAPASPDVFALPVHSASSTPVAEGDDSLPVDPVGPSFLNPSGHASPTAMTSFKRTIVPEDEGPVVAAAANTMTRENVGFTRISPERSVRRTVRSTPVREQLPQSAPIMTTPNRPDVPETNHTGSTAGRPLPIVRDPVLTLESAANASEMRRGIRRERVLPIPSQMRAGISRIRAEPVAQSDSTRKPISARREDRHAPSSTPALEPTLTKEASAPKAEDESGLTPTGRSSRRLAESVSPGEMLSRQSRAMSSPAGMTARTLLPSEPIRLAQGRTRLSPSVHRLRPHEPLDLPGNNAGMPGAPDLNPASLPTTRREERANDASGQGNLPALTRRLTVDGEGGIGTVGGLQRRGPRVAGAGDGQFGGVTKTQEMREQLTARSQPLAPPKASVDGNARQTTSTQPGSVSIVIGEVRFGSDWNSSPMAVANLVDAYRRRVASRVKVEKRTVALSPKTIADCQLLFMTGNLAFSFTDKEIEALRAYITAGGLVWVNDSSREGDDTFDRAVRRELARVVKSPLKRIPQSSPVLASAYDFSKGYLGYSIPPGDKYRLDYLEGIDWNGRIAVLYTRNDYADGMALDPGLNPMRPSLTDLSGEEMLEGSLRFGINVITYAMGGDQASLLPGTEADPLKKQVALNPDALTTWQNFDAHTTETCGWELVTGWSNPGRITIAPDGAGGKALRVDMREGEKHKVAVKYEIPAQQGRRLDLSGAKSIVLDLYNSHHGGFGASLVLTTFGQTWQDFESQSVYLKPGWNRNIRFSLTGKTFKTRKTGWKNYDSSVENPENCGKITLLLYNRGRIEASVLLDNIRLELGQADN